MSIFNKSNMQNLAITSKTADIRTVIRILFAWDYAQGQPTRVLQFEAPEMIDKFGRIVEEVKAIWLRSPRDAAFLGQRLIGWKSRPRWGVSFATGIEYHTVAPGDVITLDHLLLPISVPVDCMVLDSEPDYLQASTTITTEIPAGPIPRITMAPLSSAWAPMTQDGIDIIYANGIATFTILDDFGQPLPGAQVTIDNGTTKTTDRAGRVQFAAARGNHHLLIKAAGYADGEADVTV